MSKVEIKSNVKKYYCHRCQLKPTVKKGQLVAVFINTN